MGDFIEQYEDLLLGYFKKIVEAVLKWWYERDASCPGGWV